MKSETKRWTQLGLGAALAGSALLAACGQNAPSEPTAIQSAQADKPAADTAFTEPNEADASAIVASDAGEGEGGVAIDAARTDPVVFRSALAITEAHIVAARDAYIEGNKATAGEMFAHPVSEVLFDVGPILEERGVEPFDQLLTDASAAAFEDASVEDISARTDEIIATLRAAAKKAPDDGSTEAEIAAGVAADQIDRAAVMYRIAMDGESYEPYLDGYGFFKSASALYAEGKDGIVESNPAAAAAIEKALGLLATAYPSALRPDELTASPAALTAAASGVLLETAD